jgi:hypothetical protein
MDKTIRNLEELKIGQCYTLINEDIKEKDTDKAFGFEGLRDYDDTDIERQMYLLAIIKLKKSNFTNRKYALFYYPDYSKYKAMSLESLGVIKKSGGYHPTIKLLKNDKTPIGMKLNKEEVRRKIIKCLSLNEKAELNYIKF